MNKKMKRKYRTFVLGILFTFLSGASMVYIEYIKYEIPDTIYLEEYSDGTINFNLPFVGTANLKEKNGSDVQTSLNLVRPLTIYSGEIAEYEIDVKLFGIWSVKNVKVVVRDEVSVIAGGIPVGIYIETEGILVVDIGEIATASGEIVSPSKGNLMSGDYITAINGVQVTNKERFSDLINEFGNTYVTLTVRRDGKNYDIKVKPVKDLDDRYRIGIWVRDDCQGLGTLTYVDANGNFGTLGHSISDSDTGEIVEIESGRLYTAKIWSVIKGKSGEPGEVIGSINYGADTHLGVINENNPIGIYGTVDDHIFAYLDKTYMNIAYKQDIQIGTAYIRTFIGEEITDYEIYIYDLHYSDSKQNKGIEFCVTDDKLLDLTNGIVQGMFTSYNGSNNRKASKIKGFLMF